MMSYGACPATTGSPEATVRTACSATKETTTFGATTADDWLDGGEDDDFLLGGTGNDSLDGGSGADQAAFNGFLDEFRLEPSGDRWIVTRIATGEVDIVTNVESLLFQGAPLVEFDAAIIGTDGNDTIDGTPVDDTVLDWPVTTSFPAMPARTCSSAAAATTVSRAVPAMTSPPATRAAIRSSATTAMTR